MKKSSLFQFLSALALIALLGTSLAQEAPEPEVRFPDQWGPTGSEPPAGEDTSALERLERARTLVLRSLKMQSSRGQYPSLPTPPSMQPRFEAARVRPCLARAGGAGDGLCAQARAISRMPACLHAEDCQAYDTLRQLTGEPEVRKVPSELVPLWKTELASAPLAEEALAEEE